MLQLLAREGNDAPGTPSGAKFGDFPEGFSGFALNNQGQVAFVNSLQQGAGGVNTGNDSGIWAESTNVLTLVAREGDQAPGVPAGGNFAGFSAPNFNNSNEVAFTASLQTGSGGVINENSHGIWYGRHGSLNLVVRAGDHAPGTSADTRFRYFYQFSLNDAGDIAFRAELGPFGVVDLTNFAGIWAMRNGSLELIARQGEHAPGTGPNVVFDDAGLDFRRPLINGKGEVAFIADLQRGFGGVNASNNRGIWTDTGGDLHLVVRTGDQAPGAPAGAVFSDFPYPAGFNFMGQVAFMARLRSGFGGVNSTNDHGIWVQDRTGVLQFVIREGDVLDVDNGPGIDLRTISTLTFGSDSGNEDGMPSTFNDYGQLTFHASFIDGSDGVFVWSPVFIPEPSSSITAAMAFVLIIGARHRRPKPNQCCQTDSRMVGIPSDGSWDSAKLA
jgi:hypothetical protein